LRSSRRCCSTGSSSSSAWPSRRRRGGEVLARVVEILLAAIPARAPLAGKILGIGLVGLLQLALTAVAGLLAASLSGAIELGTDHAGVLAVVLVWFVLGYLLYAALYAVAGVLVSRQEDMQSSSTPVTMVLVAGYLVAFPVLEDPNSSLAASVGLLVLSIGLLIPLAARIYEGSVLRMGKPLKVREAMRAARTVRTKS